MFLVNDWKFIDWTILILREERILAIEKFALEKEFWKISQLSWKAIIIKASKWLCLMW